MSQDEEKVLTNLGLTLSQSKVYLALIHNGPSKVIGIANISGIHRAHLYQILKSLEELGLVEKRLGTGLYTSTPLNEALKTLIKQRQDEIHKVELEAKAIIESHKKIPKTLDDSEIILTSNKALTLNKAQKYIETATKTLDLMHTWKRFIQLWQHYEVTFESAMKRGVAIRQIVQAPKDSNQAPNFLSKHVFKNKLFELRLIPVTGGNFTIIDDERILISTTQEKENLGETPLLFSNYEGLLGLMQNYFSVSWKNATKWNEAKNCSSFTIQPVFFQDKVA